VSTDKGTYHNVPATEHDKEVPLVTKNVAATPPVAEKNLLGTTIVNT